MPAGLYAVRLFRAIAGSNRPVSEDVWVLLASGHQYDSNAAAYRDNVELTRQWQSLNSGAVHTFLRACLDQLAAPGR